MGSSRCSPRGGDGAVTNRWDRHLRRGCSFPPDAHVGMRRTVRTDGLPGSGGPSVQRSSGRCRATDVDRWPAGELSLTARVNGRQRCRSGGAPCDVGSGAVRAIALVAAGCSLPSTAPGTAGFPNGVAAGDVTASSAILWTRTLGRASSTSTCTTTSSFPAHRSSHPATTPVFTASGSTSAATDFTVKIPVERPGVEPHLLLPVHQRRGVEPARALRHCARRERGRVVPLRRCRRLRRLHCRRAPRLQQLRGARRGAR